MSRWSNRGKRYGRPFQFGAEQPVPISLPKLSFLEKSIDNDATREFDPHRFVFVFEPTLRLAISPSSGCVRSLEPGDEQPADLVFNRPGQRIGISESNEPLVNFFRSNKWFRPDPEQ